MSTMNKTLHTKFGTARLQKRGYYQITSGKEGNHGKWLHRLIWENFYNTEIPEEYHIHHKNGNPIDNCILNLQLMRESEHHSLHSKGENHPQYGKRGEKSTWYGRKHTTESRKKISDNVKGENHPRAKYKLWDINCTQYDKNNMFGNGREPNPCKCFKAKYKGKKIPIGGFCEFVSPQIITDLIKKEMI